MIPAPDNRDESVGDTREEIAEELTRRLAEETSIKLTAAPTSKVCRNCGEEKPAYAFYTSRKYSDGLTRWCSACLRDADADIGTKKLRLSELIERGERGDVAAQEEIIRRARQAIERGDIPGLPSDSSE